MSLFLLILLLALAIGWVAGMWTRRNADHWCRDCGAALKCPDPCCRPAIENAPRLRVRRQLQARRPV